MSQLPQRHEVCNLSHPKPAEHSRALLRTKDSLVIVGSPDTLYSMIVTLE